MTTIVRRCTRCGSLDRSRSWGSLDAAAEQGALRSWACPMCAWPEAELADADGAGPGPDDPVATMSAGPAEADAGRPTEARDHAADGTDPNIPSDPDEARRAAGVSARIAR